MDILITGLLLGGTYTLIAWHPKFKREKKQEITVAASGVVSADFEFKARVRKKRD